MKKLIFIGLFLTLLIGCSTSNKGNISNSKTTNTKVTDTKITGNKSTSGYYNISSLKLLILVMLKIRLCCIILFSLSFYLGYSCPGIPQFTLPTTWCVNSPVTFNNTSTNSPQSYTWSFGDASAAVTVTNDNDQTHTYNAPGNYQIKLIIFAIHSQAEHSK